MAWTAPRTWVADEIVTAALMNTHLRDNLLETAAAKVTTAGDIFQATGANAGARLPIGTARQVQVVNSGATGLEYVTRHLQALSAKATANTTINSGTYADLNSMSVTLTLNEVSTVIVLFTAELDNDTGGGSGGPIQIRAVIDGTNTDEWAPLLAASGTQAVSMHFALAGVAAGATICKIQWKRDGGATVGCDDRRITAFAMPE